jgi:uncharacterized membrane protein
LKLSEPWALWVLFFLTNAYGHLALKMAVGSPMNPQEGLKRALVSWAGWSTLLAWSLAGLLWVCVLSRSSLFRTNSISMVNYLLVCFLAMGVLGERLSGTQWIGMSLIGLGIYLTGR